MPCVITPIIPLGTNSVPQASLPVTCLLDGRPPGVTIKTAILVDSASQPTNLTVTGGNSFAIPNSIAKGNYKLNVKLQGALPDGVPVFIAEACPDKTQLLVIMDQNTKLGFCILEVV